MLRLWHRFLLGRMKYLLFLFPCFGNKAKRGVLLTLKTLPFPTLRQILEALRIEMRNSTPLFASLRMDRWIFFHRIDNQQDATPAKFYAPAFPFMNNLIIEEHIIQSIRVIKLRYLKKKT